MKFVALVEAVILKLSVIPGLGFLYEYVRDYRIRKSTFKGNLARYTGYVAAVRGAGQDIATAARGSQREEPEDDDEDDEEEETDDFESFMQ